MSLRKQYREIKKRLSLYKIIPTIVDYEDALFYLKNKQTLFGKYQGEFKEYQILKVIYYIGKDIYADTYMYESSRKKWEHTQHCKCNIRGALDDKPDDYCLYTYLPGGYPSVSILTSLVESTFIMYVEP